MPLPLNEQLTPEQEQVLDLVFALTLYMLLDELLIETPDLSQKAQDN